MFPEGKVVIARVSNSAISSPTALSFKDINGVAHTFKTGERLIIDTIKWNNRATAKDITVFQDTNGGGTLDAGEELSTTSFGGAGVWTDVFMNGLPSQRINAAATNTFMVVGSAAGSTDILVIGQVIRD